MNALWADNGIQWLFATLKIYPQSLNINYHFIATSFRVNEARRTNAKLEIMLISISFRYILEWIW